MNRKDLYIILFLLVTFSACEHQDSVKHNWNNTHTLVEEDRLILKIDSLTNRRFNQISYLDSESLLFIYNESAHSMYLYDIVSKNLISKINLMKEGPDGTDDIDCFYAHSIDSIFVYNSISGNLRMIDSEGAIQRKWKIREPEEPSITTVPKIFFDGSKVYLPVIAYKATSKELQEKTLLVYDLETEEKEFLGQIKSTSTRWGNRYLNRDGTFIREKKAFVTSWSMYSDLYELKLGSGITNQVPSYSERMHPVKPYKKSASDKLERRYYDFTNSWYENLYYAEDQRILLRSAVVGQQIPKNEPLNRQYKSKNGDDIYVLTELFNDQLEKIGEVPRLIFYNEIFSSSNYIFVADYLHDKDNEDIIVFKKLALKKLESNGE